MGSNEGQGLDQALGNIYRLAGVLGLCLQNGSRLLANHLPFSDARTAALITHIEELCSGYQAVGRDIRQFCAGFDDFWLLIICNDSYRLCLLIKPNAEISLISSSGRQFLIEYFGHPAPSVPTFVAPPPEPLAPVSPPPIQPAPVQNVPANGNSNGELKYVAQARLREITLGLMARVMGHAQASRLIERELVKFPSSSLEMLPLPEAEMIGSAILTNIPNRNKRETLISELRKSLLPQQPPHQ